MSAFLGETTRDMDVQGYEIMSKMRFWCHASVVSVCLLSCAAVKKEQSPPSTVAPASDTPESSVTSGADDGLASHSNRHEDSATRHSSEPPAAGDAVDISDWCARHGIAANLDVERCVSTQLGANPDDNLWCSRHEELDDNRIVYYLALYRVQAKRLQKITEIAYAAGPRPMEDREHDVSYYVKLAPVVAEDGKSFELIDERGLGCEQALKRIPNEFSENPSLEKPIEQLVSRVCAGRGRYSASGRRAK
jgi:hypothetical protein